MLRVLNMNELMQAAADDEMSEVQWPVMGCEKALIECPPFPDLPEGFDKKLYYCNALECTAPCAADQAACSPAHLLAIRAMLMLTPAPTPTPSVTYNSYDMITSFGARQHLHQKEIAALPASVQSLSAKPFKTKQIHDEVGRKSRKIDKYQQIGQSLGAPTFVEAVQAITGIC
jgi:hypothetical protein